MTHDLYKSFYWTLIACLMGVFYSISASADDSAIPEKAISEPLAALAPYVDKIWISENKDKSFKDRAVWRWAVPNHVLVTEHSVNDGAYSGIAVFHYDPKTKRIISRYATSASFYTDAVITLTDKGFTSMETVKGAAGTIEFVEAEVIFNDDHEMHVSARMKLLDGTWTKYTKRVYSQMQ